MTNPQIIPKALPMQETTLIMEVTKGKSISAHTEVFKMSKSRTIDFLKKRYPYPNGFWYALNQKNEAQMIDESKATIKFKLEKKDEQSKIPTTL
jgi:hypothetical protein